MSGFETDGDLMEKAAGQIEEVRGNVEHAANMLRSQIDPALATWKGSASDTFRRLMDNFEANAQKINQKLGDIGQAVQTSGRDYVMREQEQSDEISRIEGMLEG